MEQIRYTLGLDIGIASVGWAVLQNNAQQEPKKIIDLGVRVFKTAENGKESLAAPRREARSDTFEGYRQDLPLYCSRRARQA